MVCGSILPQTALMVLSNQMTKPYTPELSEIRMVKRAPEGPLPFSSEDRAYILSCFEDVQTSFGVTAYPGQATEDLTARALIRQLIEWWRTLEPKTEEQHEAYGRMPGSIRLIDTVATWVEEREERRRNQAVAGQN
jgi:hypothetical protein